MINGNAFNQRLVIEPKQQTAWRWHHATWFTAMGIGGALYLNRVLFGVNGWKWLGISVMEILSFVLIAIGGLILIGDLGRPERFWRALTNLRTSWISWGALADFVFLFVAPLSVLPHLTIDGRQPLAWLPWGSGGPVDAAMLAVAVASAAFIIVYPAFVLAAFPSIPFWNNASLPLQFLAAAFASAGSLGVLSPVPAEARAALQVTVLALLAWLMFVGVHLISAFARRGTARLGAAEMWSGRWQGCFQFALWAGMVAPLTVGLALRGGAEIPPVVWATVCGVIWAANWLSKRALLGAGYFEPLL